MMTYEVFCDVTRCYATLSLSLQELEREDVLDVNAYIIDKGFVKRCYFLYSHLRDSNMQLYNSIMSS